MIRKRTWGTVLVDGVIYLLLALITLSMFFPFLYVFTVSFSTYEDYLRGGVLLWPRRWSLDAYRFVLNNRGLMRSVAVSIFLATFGTLWNVIMTSSMAYALGNRHLVFRRFWFFFVLIPWLFGSPMIPRFLVVKAMGLYDSILALIIPGSIAVWNLIVMRNFFMGLPPDLIDAAEMDGATDLQVLWRVVVPLSKPILAAIGLFYAVGHWNAYFNAILYLQHSRNWPVQVYLRLIVLMGQMAALMELDLAAEADVIPPTEVIQMAAVIVATVPILCVYPFLQRHFTKGVLTGSIKG